MYNVLTEIVSVGASAVRDLEYVEELGERIAPAQALAHGLQELQRPRRELQLREHVRPREGLLLRRLGVRRTLATDV